MWAFWGLDEDKWGLGEDEWELFKSLKPVSSGTLFGLDEDCLRASRDLWGLEETSRLKTA